MWPEGAPRAAHGVAAIDTAAPPTPELCRLPGEPQQRYWLCRPRQAARAGAPPAGLLVTVHGISRNAHGHARALAALADGLGLALVAPHFSRTRFPDYQRLGRPGRTSSAGRADHMLLRVVHAVRAELGLPAQPFLLVGHSGGAQFTLRFTLAHARRVAGYALSAPGSYCWPDPARRFPLGLAPNPDLPDLQASLPALLQRPGLVLVGSNDTERDGALRQGARIDAEQGHTRVERARRWVEAMGQAAQAHGMAAPLRLHTIGGCAHGFSELARHPLWRDALRRHLQACLAAGPGAAAVAA